MRDTRCWCSATAAGVSFSRVSSVASSRCRLRARFWAPDIVVDWGCTCRRPIAPPTDGMPALKDQGRSKCPLPPVDTHSSSARYAAVVFPHSSLPARTRRSLLLLATFIGFGACRAWHLRATTTSKCCNGGAVPARWVPQPPPQVIVEHTCRRRRTLRRPPYRWTVHFVDRPLHSGRTTSALPHRLGARCCLFFAAFPDVIWLRNLLHAVGLLAMEALRRDTVGML